MSWPKTFFTFRGGAIHALTLSVGIGAYCRERERKAPVILKLSKYGRG